MRNFFEKTGYWERKRVGGTPPCAKLSTVLLESNKRIYLFGLTALLQPQCFSLDVHKYPLIWKEEILNNDEKAPEFLKGMTMNMWNHKLLLFGGGKEVKASNECKSKVCQKEIYLYDFKSKEWEIMLNRSKTVVDGRIYHCSKIAKNLLFVHGGFDHKNQYHNSLQICDLVTSKWTSIDLGYTLDARRVNHTMTLVNPLFKGTINWIYLFGGQNRFSKPTNTMFRIKLSYWKEFKDPKDLKMKLVEIEDVTEFENFDDIEIKAEPLEVATKGKPPVLREAHSAVLLENNKILVYGGRNDYIHPLTNSMFTNDLIVYDIANNIWQTMKYAGVHPPQRCGASMIDYNGEIMMFGGLTAARLYKLSLLGENEFKEKVEEISNLTSKFYETLNPKMKDRVFIKEPETEQKGR